MKAIDLLPRLLDRSVVGVVDPDLIALMRDYLSLQKVVACGDRLVMNVGIPPFPSPAFEGFMRGLLGEGGDDEAPLVRTAAVAVTDQGDGLPPQALKRIVAQTRDLGAALVILTGSEPLARRDLEDLCGAVNEEATLLVETSGEGLDAVRAARLASAGVWGVGVRLERAGLEPVSEDAILERVSVLAPALTAVREAGMYPYVIAPMTAHLLEETHFVPFILAAREAGAAEVHFRPRSAHGEAAAAFPLSPSGSGQGEEPVSSNQRRPTLSPTRACRSRWKGEGSAGVERARAEQCLRAAANHEEWPVVSFASFFESREWFGCTPGRSAVYVDGRGEVCPSAEVPLSFGNALEEPLAEIVRRMQACVDRAGSRCLSAVLADDIAAAARDHGLPLPPAVSRAICAELPQSAPGDLSRLEAVKARMRERSVGAAELQVGYDAGADHYDGDFLTTAGRSVQRLVELLAFRPGERVLDAGCGTGFTTRLAAHAVGPTGCVRGIDISENMLQRARELAAAEGLTNCEFVRGELLAAMEAEPEAAYDACTCTWVIGYVSLKDVVRRAARLLRPGGRLGIVSNAAHSPREIISVAIPMLLRHPVALRRTVNFPFPSSPRGIRKTFTAAGFGDVAVETGSFVRVFADGRAILEHFERSGEAEVYRQSIKPEHLQKLIEEFIGRLEAKYLTEEGIRMTHEYFVMTAVRR